MREKQIKCAVFTCKRKGSSACRCCYDCKYRQRCLDEGVWVCLNTPDRCGLRAQRLGWE